MLRQLQHPGFSKVPEHHSYGDLGLAIGVEPRTAAPVVVMATHVCELATVFATLLFLGCACSPSQADADTTRSARILLENAVGYEFGCCGGTLSAFPAASDNPLVSCPKNYGCRRNSARYWQCIPGAPVVQPYSAPMASPPPPSPSPLPPSTPPPPPQGSSGSRSGVKEQPTSLPQAVTNVNCIGCTVPIDAWRQCGGKSNCAPGASCLDAEWAHGCCVAGFSCKRAYEWYWQCIPAEDMSSSSSPSTQAMLSSPTSTPTAKSGPSPIPTSPAPALASLQTPSPTLSPTPTLAPGDDGLDLFPVGPA